ncbi:HD domain-containing protein [Jiangella mangrovi]|uniref:Putative metal-dependent HD superfamily phosphohydrolase n=1 Tax=Jiangella mangrovi TaxID=1524084 RepID=A0A7W9GME4_9ACTN|nr:metal-dependent phosphohydrolase [Jiangella mangrovi]MBB5786557.1 putative metal-dependent HD superfamily phosphohydrolase [Jiangella mangrovi]
MDELERQWSALAGDSPAATAAGADLLVRWAEPHRRYHATGHLTAILAAVDELLASGEPADPDAVRFAAWFHDAVYDGKPGQDEAASARLAREVLTALGRPAALVDEVERLVLLTAGHDPAPGDANGAVLCDADLAVLAGSPAEYGAYAAAVRDDYAHVPDADFAAGRAAVLAGLLDRPALFRTETGRARWETAARHNLGTELVLLRASAS